MSPSDKNNVIPPKQPIGVIGAGSFGTTIAHLLAHAGRPIYLYARNKDTVKEINSKHTNSRFFEKVKINKSVKATNSLEEVCQHCTLIFPVLPTKAFRQVMIDMSASLRADHVMVHGTKGIEPDTFKTMSEIILDETCVRLVGAVAGPNLAKEIMAGKPAATVIGSRFDAVNDLVAGVLRTPNFLVYGNNDIRGVELGGALKNILAIGAGIVDGAGFGDNTKSLLVTRGLAELARLGVSMGAEQLTFSGLSGIGDIMATCSSPLSRNYQVGHRIGKGETLDEIMQTMTQVAEGVSTTSVVYHFATRHGVEMSLTRGLYRVLYENASVVDVQEELFQEPISYEIDRAYH